MNVKTESHLTDDVDFRPTDDWFRARCICGWTAGSFPDIEDMVDALMEHAYDAGRSSQPTPTEGGPQ